MTFLKKIYKSKRTGKINRVVFEGITVVRVQDNKGVNRLMTYSQLFEDQV